MIPAKFSKYITQEEFLQVENAVVLGEEKTSAEIVPVIVKSSTPKEYISLMLTLLILLITYVTGEIFLLILIVFIFGINRLSKYHFILERAIQEFELNKIRDTEDSVGVLVFMSLKEKKIVVLLDKALSDYVLPEELTKIVHNGLECMKKTGKVSDAMIQVINETVDVVKAFAPPINNNNELPNHLILKD